MAKGVKTGGRVAGTPNKITKDLKDMILGALEDVGGQKYLEAQATENPAAFMSLMGKTLPKDIRADIVGRLAIVLNGKGVGP
jgi:hypothetical protein